MQDVYDISFPHLGIYLHNVPYGIHIGSLYIAYYGCFIALGVMAGIITAAKVAKKYGMNPDVIWDFAIYAVICSVIGARLYYVIFSFDEYKDDLMEIFRIRNGGLAIYGGVIVAFITLFVYSKIKKMKALQLGDVCMPGLLIGQVIGRWGNFMNREVFGDYTDSLLAMRIPISAVRDSSDITQNIWDHVAESDNFIQVHPTFLYESVCNLLLMIAILLYFKYRKFDGEICLCYLGGYGIIRFFMERIRTDRLMLGHTNIAVSEALGISLFVLAVLVDVIVRIRLKKQPESPTNE